MISPLAIASLFFASTAFAVPTIRSLGVLNGPPPNGGWTSAMASDGRTVCGFGNARHLPSGSPVTLGAVARLSPQLQGNYVSLAPLSNNTPFNTFGFAFGASNLTQSSPSYVVGYSTNASGLGRATLWLPNGSPQELPSPDPFSLSAANDISPDALTAVGSAGTFPCKWSLPGGSPVFLPLNSFIGGRAYSISADRLSIVGAAYVTSPNNSVPVRWLNSQLPQSLGILTAAVSSQASNISDDASTIVGSAQNQISGGPFRAFVYRDSHGMLELAPLPATLPSCWASCTSADGKLIGGFDEGNSRRALLWNRPHNPRLLADILSSLGVNLSGWTLSSVKGISADGTVLSGIAFLNGVELSFLVTLPPHCHADYNLDYSTDFFDYLDFVADFSVGRIDADFNLDGAIDLFDYLDFVAAFGETC